jgi:hypothetical protein
VSGYKSHYKFVLSAGAKAKSMTNNLPILSVLYVGLILKLSRCRRAFLPRVYSRHNHYRRPVTIFK